MNMLAGKQTRHTSCIIHPPWPPDCAPPPPPPLPPAACAQQPTTGVRKVRCASSQFCRIQHTTYSSIELNQMHVSADVPGVVQLLRCAVLCHHFAPSCQSEDDAPSANQTMTNPQTHTGRATKALQDPTTEAPMAVPAHRLGFGLHRCQTLLPRAAAYLRSLHQPGICIRVAPKMRKRPTSCSSGQAHAHQHKRRHILILAPWIHHASCWRKKPHQVLWHTMGVVPARQCQHGFECPASTALLLGPTTSAQC